MRFWYNHTGASEYRLVQFNTNAKFVVKKERTAFIGFKITKRTCVYIQLFTSYNINTIFMIYSLYRFRAHRGAPLQVCWQLLQSKPILNHFRNNIRGKVGVVDFDVIFNAHIALFIRKMFHIIFN